MQDKKTMLYNSATELFSEKGFADTNVSEIVKKTGMAVGTFYLYYPSKEQLFMEIFLAENTRLKRACLDALDLNQTPTGIINQMLTLNLSGMKANPILKEWYNTAVFHKIEQKYREANGLKAVDFLYDSFTDLVTEWQAEGKMRKDIDSKMIMMIFAAIINVDTHKDEIGIEYFPELLQKMTELVMQSLTNIPG
jgi:AcrR family transcriptional regulator